MAEYCLTEINPYLGLEINFLDLLAEATASKLASLKEHLTRYHLLVIRNQQLSEESLIRIANCFGEPVAPLLPTYRLKNYPVISRHSNIKDKNNNAVGVIAPEYIFHSDSYFTVNPAKETLFYSITAPEQGGDTYFVNTCLAYESLDCLTQKFIDDKIVRYKNAFINQPPVEHPLVRVHPVTNKKSLYVNKHRALGIIDMDDAEALDLVNTLYQHAIQDKYVYKHKWKDGDLLIWNNPTTMHCATYTDDQHERLLYRILIKGLFPVV